MSTKTVGLIGYGNFGELLVGLLHGRVKTRVYSRSTGKIPEHLRASLEEVAACDYVVIAVPLAAYRSVLTELAKHIASTAVVIDVCSVKVIPCELIAELLPHNRTVATHPLFGPQTASKSLKGLTMVICDEQSDAAQALLVDRFCRLLGLSVVHMSAEEHDKQMAKVHALTFFIARGLFGMGLEDVELKTPSFQRLESLLELEKHHTHDLYETIQLGNTFAGDVRETFLQNIQELNDELKQATKEY